MKSSNLHDMQGATSNKMSIILEDKVMNIYLGIFPSWKDFCFSKKLLANPSNVRLLGII